MIKSDKVIKLNNGVMMPVIGFGVYKILPGEQTRSAVLSALSAGYRLFDTAEFYKNEQDVGMSIKQSGVNRDEIFITTKLHPLALFNTEKHFNESLQKLGLEYVDLFLVHYPSFRKSKIWRVLEKVYAQGRVRAIGVSNFTINDLKSILESATIVPAVHQVEFHPFCYQKELFNFCVENGIALEAHSPLAHGNKLPDSVIVEIGGKYKKSSAQILLRWLFQHNIVSIPKTTHPNHMVENINIFDFSITEDDMIILDNLNENYHAAWLGKISDRKMSKQNKNHPPF